MVPDERISPVKDNQTKLTRCANTHKKEKTKRQDIRHYKRREQKTSKEKTRQWTINSNEPDKWFLGLAPISLIHLLQNDR